MDGKRYIQMRYTVLGPQEVRRIMAQNLENEPKKAILEHTFGIQVASGPRNHVVSGIAQDLHGHMFIYIYIYVNTNTYIYIDTGIK